MHQLFRLLDKDSWKLYPQRWLWQPRKFVIFIKKPIYHALIVLKNSIETGQILNQNIYVTAKIPRRIYIWAAHIGWRKQAKINNLKTKDLY